MQTFLPYSDFLESAKVLDKRRCWKQVVEAKQIIQVLTKLEENPQEKVPWMNHPAVRMWEGYLDALKVYYNVFLNHCVKIHGIKTKLEPVYFELNPVRGRFPWWYGDYNFHRSMRARLIEKDREFYLPKFPEDEGYNDGKYWWPDMKTKTFKII